MKKIYLLFIIILVFFISGRNNSVLAAVPLTPQLISPSDSAPAVDLPTLQWTDVVNEAQNEYYNVLLKLSTESDWHYSGIKLADNQITLNGLGANITYNWIVETCYEQIDPDGNYEVCSPRSPTWSFTTAVSLVAPAKPNVIAPGNGDVFDEASPVLQWTNTVAAGGWYRVYYKKTTDSTFTDVGYDITANSRMIYLDSLSKEGTYQWYVKACNTATLCTDSDVWSFVVVECTDNTWCPPGATCVGNVCVPPSPCDNECNGTCGEGCTIKQDPDCGCSKTLVNNCCPEVKLCTSANDIDCSADDDSDDTSPGTAENLINPLPFDSLEEFLNAIVNFVVYIAMALVPLMFIIGGFYFLTGGGDPKRIETGKRIMLFTAIGMLIILLARALVSVVKYFIGS